MYSNKKGLSVCTQRVFSEHLYMSTDIHVYKLYVCEYVII